MVTNEPLFTGGLEHFFPISINAVDHSLINMKIAMFLLKTFSEILSEHNWYKEQTIKHKDK